MSFVGRRDGRCSSGCSAAASLSDAVGLCAAAGLAAVYPMLFLSEATLMAESLYVALVALAVAVRYRAHDEPKPARFVVLGVRDRARDLDAS